MLGQVVSGSIVRVKMWSRDGRVLYSDEPALIGRRFALGEDELRLFDSGGATAELSDLDEPENRFERSQGKLLEAHTTIRTPTGRNCCSRSTSASSPSTRAPSGCCGRSLLR